MSKDLQGLSANALTTLRRFSRYKLVLFLVLLAIIYGFLVLQISSDNSVQPSGAALSQQTTAHSVPRIDPKLVQQLDQLQNNSVSVHALFNQGRSNPFQ